MQPLDIFKQLTRIPHGSGNTKAISDYCVSFARARGFEARQDALNNVLILLPATPGYESHPPVILQGHLDMVCEKEPDSPHDFRTDPLELTQEGDWLFARGTTLGADDGVAVAFGLALLEENTPHPRTELFFTVDEETGMDGAMGFEPAWLSGRRLLNVDSEEEGVFIHSAAGGASVTGRLAPEWEPCTRPVYEITVSGLQGGHSGSEIHKGLANANHLLGIILSALPCRLILAEGGNKSNAIARTARALVAAETPIDAGAFTARFRREYGDLEPELTVRVSPAAADQMLTAPCSAQAIALLAALPHGVQAWSNEIEGLVETSANFGILKTEASAITAHISLRSMKNAERDRLCSRVAELFRSHGAAVECGDGYPAWEFSPQSGLRTVAASAYRALTGKEPRMIALHAGLECGIFSARLPGLEAISFGPDMHDIHTTRERLSVSSMERTWALIKEILKRL